MPITHDAATWDEEQLQEELAIRMPPGWTFDVAPNESINRWVVTIFGPKGEQAWEGDGITAQLVLLDALGWMETRSIHVSDTSPWVRRRGELNPQRVHEHIFSKMSTKDDPPDLDPSEVQAVYSNRTKRH